MGRTHPQRTFVSRRDFLRGAAGVLAATAAGPTFWRQLAYSAGAPVVQIHATLGADAAREAAFSWMTPAPVASPFVEIGGARFPAITAQYPGYPGYFHHAPVTGLEPDTSYAYQIGHDDAVVAGPIPFSTGPAGRARFSFTAFGDQGVDVGTGVPPISQPPNQAGRNTVLARTLDPAFHLIVGDLAYANGEQSVWDTWFSMIEPMARSAPWMPCIGNHEIETQLDVLGTSGGWGEWGYDPYRTRFWLPGNGFDDLRNCFYAFRYGSVVFLMLDNNDVNEEVTPNIGYTGGRQRAWVEQALAAARLDPGVDFVVVGMHQCAFSSSTKHGSDSGVQAAWLELFDRYHVDLVLQGHDHVYERTHGMKGTAVATYGVPTYRTDGGTVFITVGNGGAVQEVFQPMQPGWSAYRQQLKIGTLRVSVDPFAPGGMRRMTLGEYWALDGSPIEEGIVLERPAVPQPAAVG